MSDVKMEIKEIVSDIIGINPENLDNNASFMDDLGLDSLKALEILAAIENKYSIVINPERLQEMTTLNNVIKITEEYLKWLENDYACF